jgi:tRNA-dihydrouridine synthase A
LAIAPMMDWTDRHCRFFHRQLTRRALLYTEMVVADAVDPRRSRAAARLRSGRASGRLQLGGSDPAELAEAARIGAGFGYDEINLNVGCPSDRVQSGTFGACLMRTPGLVGDCVAAMKAAVSMSRHGEVPARRRRPGHRGRRSMPLADAVVRRRRRRAVGARPQGLAERAEPEGEPRHPAARLRRRWPDRFVGINGGIPGIDEALAHLAFVDGVMLGRAAYHTPGILADVDRRIYGEAEPGPDLEAVVAAMADHAGRHIAAGGRLAHVTRHMTGLFHGQAGARRFRQILSTDATRPGAGPEVLLRAADAVARGQASDAA